VLSAAYHPHLYSFDNEANMAEITLVNLYSQREAVAKYLKGWDVPAALDWMRQHGTVFEPSEASSARVYVFESKTGLKAPFSFTENGDLEVFDSGWLT
jgi:hypothetical protein